MIRWEQEGGDWVGFSGELPVAKSVQGRGGGTRELELANPRYQAADRLAEACRPSVTSLDAGTDMPRSAPEAVQSFNQLRWESFPEGKDDPLAEVLVGKPFGDALAALLQHMPTLLRELLSETVDHKEKLYLFRNPLWLSITLERPFHSAKIHFRAPPGRLRTREFFGVWSNEYREQRKELFRRSIAEVFSSTLLHVSKVLAPEEWATLRPNEKEACG